MLEKIVYVYVCLNVAFIAEWYIILTIRDSPLTSSLLVCSCVPACRRCAQNPDLVSTRLETLCTAYLVPIT